MEGDGLRGERELTAFDGFGSGSGSRSRSWRRSGIGSVVAWDFPGASLKSGGDRSLFAAAHLVGLLTKWMFGWYVTVET